MGTLLPRGRFPGEVTGANVTATGSARDSGRGRVFAVLLAQAPSGVLVNASERWAWAISFFFVFSFSV